MRADKKKQLTAKIDELIAIHRSTGWAFEPQHAVDLLFSSKAEDFKFEKTVNLYLFFIWCIKLCHSNNPRGIPANAASVALNLTHQVTLRGILKGGRFKGSDRLKKQIETKWYQEFDRKFIVPVGGLANALNAPSLPSEDKLRRKVLADRAREIAIIDYIAKVLAADPKYAIRARVRDAFKIDVLDKGPDFYKAVGTKRRGAIAAAAKRGEESVGIGATKFDGLWDGAPKSIILLYVFQDIFGPNVKTFFSSGSILKRLDSDDALLAEIRAALLLYELISSRFEVVEGGKTAEKWRPVTVPNHTGAVLPKFTQAQKKRFEALKKQRPAKTAGSRAK